MDPKRIVALVVGASVMVLIFSALLVPIINDATTTEKTFDNSIGSQSYMEKLGTDTESYTLVIDGTNNPGWVTVNGVDIRPNSGTLFCIDGFGLIRNNLGFVDDRFNQVRLEFGAGPGNTNYVNLSITNGVCTYVYGTQTTPQTIDISAGGFGIIDKGSYVMTNADQHKYITSDSEIYGQGLTGVDGGVWNTQLVLKGTKDNIDVTCIYPPAQADTVFTDITAATTTVTGYNDLYDLSAITFTATYGENDPTNCTYNRIIIPAEVTADLSVTPDSGTRALLSAIPIIAMIGIVLAVVGVAIVGRNDY